MHLTDIARVDYRIFSLGEGKKTLINELEPKKKKVL